MKKGIAIAASAVVLVVAAAGAWWWYGRDRAPPAVAPPAAEPAHPLSAAQRAERDERIRQSIAHRRHLWREASYVEIRQAALGGDIVAQRRLSEVYEDCRALAGGMNSSLLLLTQLVKTDPLSQPAVAAIHHDKDRLCGQAQADLGKNPTVADYWLHKSAKSGDVVSEMRYFGRTVSQLSHGQYQYFIDKIRETGDPDAIFEMSLLLPKHGVKWPDPALAPAFEGPTAEEAWVVAACRAGYDCARGARLMNLVCLSMLSCGQPDYERHLAVVGAAGQHARRMQLVALIERSVLVPKAK